MEISRGDKNITAIIASDEEMRALASGMMLASVQSPNRVIQEVAKELMLDDLRAGLEFGDTNES